MQLTFLPRRPPAPTAADPLTGRAGRRQQLRAHLAAHPQDETAWYHLSLAANDPAEGLACLVQMLEIRAANAGLPGGHGLAGTRLRALAAQVERPPRRPLTLAAQAVGRGLLLAVAVVLALVLGPMALGARTVIILSGSMVPVIQPGSAVVARPGPAAGLQVGEVIVFASNANAVIPTVHRIIGIREVDGVRLYTTRGDANGSADPDEVALGGTAWRVWYSVPLVGYAVAWGSSRAGSVALIALPVAALLALMARDLWRARRRATTPWSP